ncbi:hypothetical protein B0H11DRAFT_2008061 [Mycena galericulata]|nr:hypothetical protein B0H11DRAFT_2008061 [Mycena galericulata]
MADSALDVDLKTLLNAIKSLPDSTQNGRRDGPLGKHLTPDLTKDDNPQPVFPTHEDGPYYVFNMRWERVFQKQPGDPDNKLEKLVSHGRGKHGLLLAHAWAEHYAGVVKSDERDLIQLRVQTLLSFITKTVNVTAMGSTVIPEDSDHVVDGENDSADDENEGQTKKRKKAASGQKASQRKKPKKTVAEDGDKARAKPKPKPKTASKAQKKAPEKSSSEDSESSSESSEDETVEGRASTKLTWSFSQYGKPKPVESKGKPVWRFNCRYCQCVMVSCLFCS